MPKARKLSDEQVLEIFSCTDKATLIAERYGIGKHTISAIKNGHIYRKVTKELRLKKGKICPSCREKFLLGDSYDDN